MPNVEGWLEKSRRIWERPKEFAMLEMSVKGAPTHLGAYDRNPVFKGPREGREASVGIENIKKSVSLSFPRG